MPQHDYDLANQSRTAFRADLNNALLAIVSQNSGATAPATTYAYQWWADTTTGLLKQRNAANSAWITIGTLASAYLGLLNNNISATQRLLGRNSAGAGVAEEVTLSQLLDWIGSAAQGDILYRGASGWERLGAGTSGYFLKTQGAGANPVWASNSLGWTFTSSPQTCAAGTLFTFAHGLGAKPTDVLVIIQCITAEVNWSVGDEMVFAIYGDSTWTSHQGVGWDATNVKVWENSSALAGFNKTGGGVNLTPGNWQIIVKAR